MTLKRRTTNDQAPPKRYAQARERRTGGLQAAFTLVELLVVISIIALLLGIIVPSYFSIRENAKYTKAKVAVKNLETAFKAYLDHYRTWPAAWGGGAKDIDTAVINILKGENDKGIAFYEFETTNSLDAWSNPYDPSATWKPYRFQVDDNYDNKIFVDGQELYRAVIVWSVCTNRTDDLSAPATKQGNVKSWD